MVKASRLHPAAMSAAFLLLSACATLRTDVVKTPSTALPPAQDTPSAQYIDAEQSRHAENQSGFRLLTLNSNALMSRLVLAGHAEHSLDLQYYIFHNDDTGRLVAQHLLKAADRGVRVRVLIDDITLDDGIDLFEALDKHENIEVRLFNPFAMRSRNVLTKSAQMLFDFRRLNRRMHNKSFIADNKVAIVGGRNIGDDYFDASEEGNFRDLDLLAIGPVVEQASSSFDSYWNDEAAFPVSAYSGKRGADNDLARWRVKLGQHARAFAESEYVQAMLEEMPSGPTADRRGQWFWGSAVLVADQPEKIVTQEDQPSLLIAPALKSLLHDAQTEVLVFSPYFVPSQQDEQDLVALAQRGVRTRVLTNSLASTDEPAVHSGYAPHRRGLLAGGVELYELKPQAPVKQALSAYGRSSAFSLHAKSFVVDRKVVFVGSMNMDQRSALLNTEMGIVVRSPPLAKAVADFFQSVSLPRNAYQLGLEDGQVIWTSEEAGKPVKLTSEPDAGPMRRAGALLLRILPIDSLL